MVKFPERFKNYLLWSAIAAFILLVVQAFGVQIDVGKYNELVNAGLGILVLAGVINNPSHGKGFKDQ